MDQELKAFVQMGPHAFEDEPMQLLAAPVVLGAELACTDDVAFLQRCLVTTSLQGDPERARIRDIVCFFFLSFLTSNFTLSMVVLDRTSSVTP